MASLCGFQKGSVTGGCLVSGEFLPPRIGCCWFSEGLVCWGIFWCLLQCFSPKNGCRTHHRNRTLQVLYRHLLLPLRIQALQSFPSAANGVESHIHSEPKISLLGGRPFCIACPFCLCFACRGLTVPPPAVSPKEPYVLTLEMRCKHGGVLPG